MAVIHVGSHGKESPVKALRWYLCECLVDHKLTWFTVKFCLWFEVKFSFFYVNSDISGLGINGTMGYALNTLMSLKALYDYCFA